MLPNENALGPDEFASGSGVGVEMPRSTKFDVSDATSGLKQSERSVLCIFPKLTEDLAKSAHMLMLRYLVEQGWRATVITITGSDVNPDRTHWNGVEIVRYLPTSLQWRFGQLLYGIRKTHGNGAVRRTISRLLLPVSVALNFPDNYAGARRGMEQLAIKLLDERDFSAILSLYSPLTSHLLAKRLSRTRQIPWVALTKDFYSWPDELLPSRVSRAVNRIKRHNEARALDGACALLTVSEYMTEYMDHFMPDLRTSSLPHCYDPAAFDEAPHQSQKDDVFRLVSVGRTIELDKEALSMLFQAVSQMRDERVITPERFRICFVGSGREIIETLMRQFQCHDFVDLIPPVNHAQAMQWLSRATCLLYPQTAFGTRRRLTEYVGSRRPILALPDYSGTMSADLIGSYGAGRIGKDAESLKRVIGDLYCRFELQGALDLDTNDEVVLRHSARQRSAELAAVLESVIDEHKFRSSSTV